MIQVEGLQKLYGDFPAVQDLSFEVAPGEVFTIIGPNGAGKTTIFNMIAGAIEPTRGRVLFEGRPLPVRRPHAVAARGIARGAIDGRGAEPPRRFEHAEVHRIRPVRLDDRQVGLGARRRSRRRRRSCWKRCWQAGR